MSGYINMDHAGWVQSSRDCFSGEPSTAKNKRAKAARKGWYAAPEKLTEFQSRAFNILGIVGGGIYNAPISWDGVIWFPRDQIIVPWAAHKGFGTWDFNELTLFVFLCHEARIRGYITHHGPRYFQIHLSQRKHHGGMAERHPSLDEAVARWREMFPADHPIVYREARKG